jgi:hypothetical protein
MSQPRGMSIGARETSARSPTSASGAIGAIASCVTVLTAPSLHAPGINSSRNFRLPCGSTVDPRRSAWKGRRAILYFRTRDSVLSVRPRPSNRVGAAQILGDVSST